MSERPNFETVTIIPPREDEFAALPLITDTQFLEKLASNSLNRKFSGVLHRGVFRGFEVALAGGMDLRIHSDGVPFGAALVERDDYSLTVRQQHDVVVTVPVAPEDKEYYVALEAFYKYGVTTKQVDMRSNVDSASIKLVSVDALETHQLVLAKVLVAANTEALDASCLDFYDRMVNGFEDKDTARRHYEDKSNPHGTNKVHIGLGLVNNWGATSEIDIDNPELYATAQGLKRLHDRMQEAIANAVTYHDFVAVGGETHIPLPYQVAAVDSVTIQGIRQTKGSAWQFLPELNQIEVAEPLEVGDEVSLTLGTPSVETTVVIAELRKHIEVLEKIIADGNFPTDPDEPTSPMEVYHGRFTADSTDFPLPLPFLTREVKLVFLQGVQQSKDIAYSINKELNIIRFSETITANMEITLAG